MLIKAYAKINISLDVVGKREDGYHLLKMIMQNIDVYDLLDFEIIEKGIKISCNKKYVPTDEKNIVYKAAKLFMDSYGIKCGVKVNINKNIPVSAGLAGGSTDAAATLKALRELLKVDISDEELSNMGLKLGADIPYCLRGGTALCEGIGEKITGLKPFKNNILVLVKPSFGVSTKEVYQRLDITKVYRHPCTDDIIKFMEEENLAAVCDNMKNILENVTLNRHKVLYDIKKEAVHLGALGSLMSGSGPSVFAFFDDMMKAQHCYNKFRSKYKEVFITRTI
ncbi:MAG: 4-(cytidine 5'-diphospho)-2-C-methyl-D-erythritol kinase [Bacillota bacterium]|nr:4-(cytidine 5'-diphospho)-2-C-methyl-D-erythritol kinase [Bacillota bacterium]